LRGKGSEREVRQEAEGERRVVRGLRRRACLRRGEHIEKWKRRESVWIPRRHEGCSRQADSSWEESRVSRLARSHNSIFKLK
jgi:hypothetical protein